MIRKAVPVVIAAIVSVAAGALIASAQSNPDEESRAAELGVPYTNFNLKTAHGLERGCNACHADLAPVVGQLYVPRGKPEQHGIFATSYGIPMRVEDCLPCHGKAFGVDIHSVHLHSKSFVGMGGNCDSCHALIDGKFVLYTDETRYGVLNGVKTLPTPAFTEDSGTGK